MRMPRSIGYSGREGLYVLNTSEQVLPFASYYKNYVRSASDLGFEGVDPDALREAVDNDPTGEWPVCTSKFDWCESSGTYAGYWIPEYVKDNVSQATQVLFGPPSWSEGFFEQLVKNHKLKMAFAFYSPGALSTLRHELSQQPRNVVYYSFSPNWGAEENGGVRMSLPDGSDDCRDGWDKKSLNGEPPILCDKPEITLTKTVSSRLQDLPEALWFFEKFEMYKEQIDGMIKSLSADSSRQELFAESCRFLKNNIWFNKEMWINNKWVCIQQRFEDKKDESNKTLDFHPVIGQ